MGWRETEGGRLGGCRGSCRGERRSLRLGGPGGEQPGLLGDDLGPLPWLLESRLALAGFRWGCRARGRCGGVLELQGLLGSRLALAGFRWGSRARGRCGGVLELQELRRGLQEGWAGGEVKGAFWEGVEGASGGDRRSLHLGGPGGEQPGLLGDNLGPLPWLLGSRLALAGK